MVDALESEMMHTIIPIFTTSTTATSRCAGIGVLTNEKAISCGVVGPIARASGLAQDLRSEAPYAAYAEMDFDVPVVPDGDVRARLLVRALEIMESCKILRQALEKLPPGEITLPATTSSTSLPEPQRAALKLRAAKSCTPSRGRKARASRAACTSARQPT